MTEILLDAIPFTPDAKTLVKRLHLRRQTIDLHEFMEFIDKVVAAARPKAYYRPAFIDWIRGDEIAIEGVTFSSRVLCVNLAEVKRVFAYVSTCGQELAEMRSQETDILHQFWLDGIMEMALQAAIEAMKADLAIRFQPAKLAVMNPGSLGDWPIQQQQPLFEVLSAGAAQTGVRLTESMLMLPVKSTSGLFFETESGFINCQLCPRQSCPNRRAPYDADLIHSKYSSDPSC